MEIKKVKHLVKKKLSTKRYAHVKNVVHAAIELAEQYGADPKKAELAAWLHDIVKEEPKEELLQLLRQDAIMSKSTEQRPEVVWHGPCAAIYARTELGITDTQVLSAVECHTTGKPNMSVLDKVLFVADAISCERDYPGVELLRSLANQDLDKAVMGVLEHTIQFVKEKNMPLDPLTWEALKELQQGD